MVSSDVDATGSACESEVALPLRVSARGKAKYKIRKEAPHYPSRVKHTMDWSAQRNDGSEKKEAGLHREGGVQGRLVYEILYRSSKKECL